MMLVVTSEINPKILPCTFTKVTGHINNKIKSNKDVEKQIKRNEDQIKTTKQSTYNAHKN